MTVAEALEQGHLGNALALQRIAVTETPDNNSAQFVLFELLTLGGHFHEARHLLRTIHSDAPTWPRYRRQLNRMLKAEVRRSPGASGPIVIPTVPAHLKDRWKAQRTDISLDRRTRLLDRADMHTPHVKGHVDGREFDGIRDMDDRFASFLELFIGKHYVWIAWESIRHVRLAAPEGILDAGYRYAVVELQDGTRYDAIVPLLYPCSWGCNGVFALGQDTDWPNSATMEGIGQRILMLGNEEIPLANCRHIELDVFSER